MQRGGAHQAAIMYHQGQTVQDSEEVIDFSEMDDSALLGKRAEMRAQLERLPPLSPDRARLTFIYDASTVEVNERARAAWTRQS